MYHSGKNPLRRVGRDSEDVLVPKGLKVRRLHKAFLRYHDPHNWPMLRAALKRMGREDLIGNGKRHLVPSYQPAGTGDSAEGRRGAGNARPFRTTHSRAERNDVPGRAPRKAKPVPRTPPPAGSRKRRIK